MLVQLEQYRQKAYLKRKRHAFREFIDCYEYCFVSGYEAYFGDYLWHVIEVDSVLVSVVEKQGQFVLVSVQFPKKSFDFNKIVEWLNNYNVVLHPRDKDTGTITDAKAIIKSLLFKGNPLLLYKKGTKTLKYNPSKLVEVTDCW
ncbi:MAG: hypothetical protein ABSC17_02970 [Thermacetogeniaceae bacterium]